MKIDLKKEFKELYGSSKKEISVVKVPKQKVISVEGKGDPNISADFQNAMSALFPVAYTLKFTYKIKEGKDYSVMPPEAFWWSEDMSDFMTAKKDNWFWKVFIVQPDFVTKDAFNAAIEQVAKKSNPTSLFKVKFETLNEENAAQIMYIGPFADEGPTIKRIHEFIKEKGHSFDGLKQLHHEIYLSDMRRTAPEKLKTIIRQSFV
jgi:hypothetical protein